MTGRSTLGIGDIRAIFQSDGNIDDSMHAFIMCVKGEARLVATSLINLTGIWSTPVEQSERRFLISLTTLIGVTCVKLNVESVWAGSEFTRFYRSSMSSGFVPSVCSVVVAKCLFSLFGSIRNGRGLPSSFCWSWIEHAVYNVPYLPGTLRWQGSREKGSSSLINHCGLNLIPNCSKGRPGVLCIIVASFGSKLIYFSL